MMQDKELTYDNLAPLYILDKELEIEPDPFRLQGDKINFTVPFSAYKMFVSRCLRNADYLATPTKELLNYSRLDDNVKLYASYLKDMAIAICKELHYAEKYLKDGTHYKHKSNGSQLFDRKFIHEVYLITDLEDSLRYYMASKDYPLPRDFREKNQELWEYANTLYYFSYNGCNQWEAAL